MERSVEFELAELGVAAPSQLAFRGAALEWLAGAVRHDAAFFHALNPRVPIETGVWRALDTAAIAASRRRWDQYAVDLGRWRDAALARGGVAADTDVFSVRERARLPYFVEFARPLCIRTCALVHLLVRGRISAVVGLCRTRAAAGAFSASDLATLRRAAPVLALGDAVHHALPYPAPLAQQRVVCVDERLSARQRDVVAHVALGHTNAQIARALGASPHTIRNQLAAIFRVIGAANRAELVRLAVLR